MITQKILSNHQAGKWALRVSSLLPPRMGRIIARWLSGWIASRKELPLVEAVRGNQWVVWNEKISSPELDLQTKRVFYQAGLSFYNLFHYFNHPEKLVQLVNFSPEIEEVIMLSQERQRGLIVAGVHLSNFDLVAQAAALHGLKAFALSIPNPDSAIQWQHDLRRRSGLEIFNATLPNLKLAINRLEAGETMVTGLDRPVPDPKLKPIFFGRPAHLAVHHVQLALHAKTPMIVMGAVLQNDGRYHIHASGEIRMKSYTDRQKELMINAEHVLEIAQEIIKKALDQWVIFQPVWPEVLPFVPRD